MLIASGVGFISTWDKHDKSCYFANVCCHKILLLEGKVTFMSISSVYPFGKVPDALLNNPHLPIVSMPPESEKQEEVIGQRIKSPMLDMDPEQRAQRDKEVTAQFHEAMRKGEVVDLTPLLKPPSGQNQDRYDPFEGKTVIENKGLGIQIESLFTADGQPIITPDMENRRAQEEAATHGFFYHDTDFLTEAAKEYATLGENEVFRFRSINDVNFIRDTLDFFTKGDYTAKEVNAVQDQMTAVVEELAKQIKNGEAPDVSKLQSTLTIGGTDVTMSQILEMQKVGKGLKESFGDLTVGPMDAAAYGKMGIAKAIGNAYGSGKGELGTMFSAAMDQLYEKGVRMAKESFANASFGRHESPNGQWKPHQKDAFTTGLNIAETFSKLDTSSKENLAKDFTAKLSTVRSMVQNYCDKYGVPTSYVGLAGNTADLAAYFNGWMNQI